MITLSNGMVINKEDVPALLIEFQENLQELQREINQKWLDESNQILVYDRVFSLKLVNKNKPPTYYIGWYIEYSFNEDETYELEFNTIYELKRFLDEYTLKCDFTAAKKAYIAGLEHGRNTAIEAANKTYD